MTRRIALAGLAAYVCQTPIEHDGKQLQVGSPIELEPSAAQPLLDVLAIDYAADSGAQALQAADAGQVLTSALLNEHERLADEMVAELLQASEVNRSLTEQLQASHATIAELRQAVASAEALKAEAQRTVEVQLAEVKSLQAEREQLRQKLAAAESATADLAAQLEAKSATGGSGKAKSK